MPITNAESGTTIDEIADGIYRISTPVLPNDDLPPGFTFNQFLIVDDKPLLYHTGHRSMFPLVQEAINSVIPAKDLRYIAFSHVESDECGALNNFLELAPQAEPLCSDTAAMVSIGDMADRLPHAMADGDTIDLGKHSVTWTATPHLPHAWECGHLFENKTRTLFCGDLFTQFGFEHEAITEEDILGPSEDARLAMDYYSHTKGCGPLIKKLANLKPEVLACMHGASWKGNGGKLLKALGKRLDG